MDRLGPAGFRKRVLFVGLWAALAPLALYAEGDQRAPADRRLLEMVDELKGVIQAAEKEHRSAPRLLQQLREIVRRYDWPWRVTLLDDDFGDGDYTAGPKWSTSGGEFWVMRGGGLGSYFAPPPGGHPERRERSAVDLLGSILLGVPAAREGSAADSAEIFTEVAITNAFVVKLRLAAWPAGERGGIEFGPYAGKARARGYRLLYEPGGDPSFTLLRVSAGRSAVIERAGRPRDLDETRTHTLEWRRDLDGTMVVLVNDREILHTVDRAYDEAFEGFSLRNLGGEYAIRQITVLGTAR